ncbi:ArsR/SmtB family transcription factor [Micromonospora rubida]|uniref:ArsR/SmtB family transcription factor n=1 Tax=Micromonospora rubida TaxID=2697657 RepID=A0ABW7STR5_9ACTN
MYDAGIQQVTDSRVLAAMSHPLRRRMLDVLKVHGPSTVSAVAGLTAQSVANASHHFRVLHRSGLVEAAPELARDGRERWWRLVSTGWRWSSRDFATDPAGAAVAEAAESLNLDHHVRIVRTWLSGSVESRGDWAGSAFSMSNWLHLTPEELAQLSGELGAVLTRWSNRPSPGEDDERKPVFVFAYGQPGEP